MTTHASSGYECTGRGTDDDKENLVDITTCTTNETSSVVHKVQRGDKIFVESYYQQDHLPHYGVMSMSFVYAHIPRNQADLLV